jgi:serine/threonine protein kinase
MPPSPSPVLIAGIRVVPSASEIELLIRMRGDPKVVQVFGYCNDAWDRQLRIVMEHCEHGNLRKVVTALPSSQWGVREVANVFLQLAAGVMQLHAKNVVHRDLKTDNALVSAVVPLTVKWADFGCAVSLGEDDSVFTELLSPIPWCAPETFAPHGDGRMRASRASDIFMLGCTYVELLTKCARKPYDWIPSLEELQAFRTADSTRALNPLDVSRYVHD